jgi:hypothetical protein
MRMLSLKKKGTFAGLTVSMFESKYLNNRMAEGMGFEPMTPISRSNRLAGGRTRPLCDPSGERLGQYITVFLLLSTKFWSRTL